MRPKRQRLTKSEFDLVFKRGSKISSPFFTLIYKKNAEENKFVFVAPKKVFKKSQERNRTRRRGYAALFEVGTTSTNKIWGVFVIKKLFSSATKEDLEKSIKKSLDII